MLVLGSIQVCSDPPRITALTLPAAEVHSARSYRSISDAGGRAAADQLHVAAAIHRRDRQSPKIIPLYRRLPLKVGIINNRSDFTSSEQIAIPGCLQLLEIFWNLVDAPGNVIISNEIFAHRAIFSTLYIGKSSGKQDHYDFGLASVPGKCQLKPHKIGLETLQTSPAF